MTETADLIVTNARVQTCQPGASEAEWVALRGSRVLEVGLGSPDARLGDATRVIDAEGGLVLPGLNDAHLHLFAGGFALTELDLRGVEGRAALAEAVATYRATNPDLGFLAAHSAAYDIVGPDCAPDRAILDAVCPDLPLLVVAEDFHTAWANSAAITLAGLERGRAFVDGSKVVLDETGHATGTLLEMEAIDHVRSMNPRTVRFADASRNRLVAEPYDAAGRAADKAVLWSALTHCAENGIVAVQNMDGHLYQLELLAELDAERGLPVRVRMPFQIDAGMTQSDLSHAVLWRDHYASDMLRCDFVKIFADGVVESGTANMAADYEGSPGHSGTPIFSDAELNAIVAEADRLGFQVAVHCVGDAAVRQVLDAYAHARRQNGWREARHRIEHVEVIRPADIARFHRLGVVASMQPTHVPPRGDGYLHLIGPERARHAFALRQLRKAGAEYVLSTDWPIAPLSPFETIRAACDRAPWPNDATDQALGLPEVIAGLTRNAAWVAFDETRRGRLLPGYRADLTVLDGDLEAGGPPSVRTTICNGRITYQSQATSRATSRSQEMTGT